MPRTEQRIATGGFLGGRVYDDLLQRLATGVSAFGEREELPSHMPFTGEAFGVVPRCTREDVREAARRARGAQGPWSLLDFEERARVFLRYHDLLLERREELLDLMQLETGKARRHALEEVLDSAVVARYYARSARRHLATRRRRGAFPVLTLTREVRHPKGLVGLISPWNYPFALTISDAVPALMAGNAVLLKPDRQTSFTALWGMELLREAGLPRDLFSLLTGEGPELGPQIIENVDFLGFTGSTKTGRIVARQAAQRLIGCSLELGGKNAMLVLEDADIGKAIEGAVTGCFSNAGQLCISMERILVHEGVYERFVGRFVERVRSMQLGTGLDYRSEMGSLISGKQLEVVSRHVRDAVERGAEVLAGGRARPDLGPYFYEPTVLAGVRAGMELFADETFGPVVTVARFSSDAESVERANDTPYGLNASVWTRNKRRGYEVAKRIRAGTVNVNEAYAAAWGSVDAPMGGMKDSGLGRRHGAEGILKYTEAQTVAVQRGLPIAAPPGVGGELYGRVMVGALKVLKAASRLAR